MNVIYLLVYLQDLKEKYTVYIQKILTYRRFAFTLAEVLVVLGIIGVVAAMTLPNVVANYRKQEIETRLKKFYNTFSNAINLSEVENGDSVYWTYAPPNFATSDSMKANDEFFNKYLFPYLKGLKSCNTRDSKCKNIMTRDEVDVPFYMSDRTKYVFPDGACFAIISEGNLYNRSMLDGVLDLNCSKGPNKGGYDQFYFYIQLGEKGKNFIPFHYGVKDNVNKYDRRTLKSLCEDDKFTCGALIQYDNWIIQDDYPLNF